MIKMRGRARGFTLVELMVAMVIALLALLAATQLYVNTRGTYRLQGMQSRLSEDGRFALSMLQRIVLQAGFHPNPNPTAATNAAEYNFLKVATAPSILNGFFDTLSATAFNVKFFGDGTNTVGCNGAAATGAQSLTIAASTTDKKLTCGTDEWIAPSGNGTELVDFKVDYGVDMATNSATANASEAVTPTDFGCGADSATSGFKVRDCVPDTYDLTIAQVNLDKIVAVRVCLVLRTEDTDSSVVKAAAYKNCSNGDITDSQTDHKLYRTFSSTIQVRNR